MKNKTFKMVALLAIVIIVNLAAGLCSLDAKAPGKTTRTFSELGMRSYSPPIRNQQDFILNYYLYLYHDEEFQYWQDYYRFTPEYVQDTLIVSIFVEEKNLTTGLWEAYYLYTYTYNDYQKVTAVEMQEWVADEWGNDLAEYYTYNHDRQLQSYLYREWIDGQWHDNLKIDYYYEQDLLVREEWEYFYEEGENSLYRGLFEHSLAGKVISETWEILWEGDWYPYTKAEYGYDEDDLLKTEMWSDLIDGDWQQVLYFIYGFENGLLMMTTGSIRSEDNQEWQNYLRYSYLYDVHDNRIEYLYQEWSGEDSEWKNIYKYVYYWEPTTDIDSGEYQRITASSQISIYPNPISLETTVSLDRGEYQKPIESVSVYDSRGRRIDSVSAAPSASDKWKITLNNEQPGGIYFFKIKTTDSHIYTKKVLLINR